MEKIGNKIRNNLLKRQEALKKFETRRISFFANKKRIMDDFEKAAGIWEKTMSQLPPKEFAEKNNKRTLSNEQ